MKDQGQISQGKGQAFLGNKSWDSLLWMQEELPGLREKTPEQKVAWGVDMASCCHPRFQQLPVSLKVNIFLRMRPGEEGQTDRHELMTKEWEKVHPKTPGPWDKEIFSSFSNLQ